MTVLKPMLHFVVHSSVTRRLMRLMEGNGDSAGYGCQVLTYHRVENEEGFAAQMAHLAAHYDVISMQDLLQAARNRDRLPPRAVLITFDDAYCNFAEVAWPILRHNRLPVTLFVPTAFPGQPQRSFWWDDLTYAFEQTDRRDDLETAAGHLPLHSPRLRKKALRTLKQYIWHLPRRQVDPTTTAIVRRLGVTPPPSRVLDWDALRALQAEGVTLGAHTRTHPNLARLGAADVRTEIAGSLQDLQREVGDPLPILTYPAGFYNEETMKIARQAGVELAFTVRRGTNDIRRREQWLALRRNNVGPQATLSVLRARLVQAAPALNHVRRLVETL